MKRIKRWAQDNLLFPAAGGVVYGAWQVNWWVGLGALIVVWHFLIARPIKLLQTAFNQSEYREWALGVRFLSVSGWANTLGDKEALAPPRVSSDLDNNCERWWYRPDGVSDGLFREFPRSSEQAVVDFSKMTMTLTKPTGSFNFELRWVNHDPFSPHIETRLVSKKLDGSSPEFIEGAEWDIQGPNGTDVAYRIYQRVKARRPS